MPEDLGINIRNFTPVSGALSGDISVFLWASLGTVCFAESLSFALLLDCMGRVYLKMSNDNHVINITFVIIQVLYWLLMFGTGADMQLKKKKKE